jgi:hypothetical protein
MAMIFGAIFCLLCKITDQKMLGMYIYAYRSQTAHRNIMLGILVRGSPVSLTTVAGMCNELVYIYCDK